jgi:hypothetical protein
MVHVMSEVPSSHELSLAESASKIFYCLPHNGEWVPEGMPSAMMPSKRFAVNWPLNRSSFLNHSFNMYWCAALNQKPRPEFWAMHHADMSAEPGWLDVLMDIMQEKQADVVSCVAAIKDHTGDTNAAILTKLDGEGTDLRRLSIAEANELPDVFCSSDIGHPLLVNTGLWLVRFGAWAEEFPGFSFNNQIRKMPNGTFVPQCLSEDWKFSMWAHERGLKIYATTRIKTHHYGTRAWVVGGPRG